jgi:hypothetical protein
MTEGWYWLHELEAAKRAGLIDKIDWLQWRAYVPCDCPKPLRSLEDWYQKRLQVGKNTPSGFALKCVHQLQMSPFLPFRERLNKGLAHGEME